MAFVTERIPGADKARIDFSAIKRPPIYLDPVDPSWWTVDRDRDAFLMETGMGGEEDRHTLYFALWWRGDIIRVSLEWSFSQQEKDVLMWRMHKLTAPPSLEHSRAQILELLKEALDAYGLMNRRGDLAEVRFDF